MPEALKKADEVLQQAVQGITDLINVPGLINLDFADVQTVMIDKGIAHIGIGKAKGDDKAIEAVKQAVSSPLLETTIAGASHVIINISGDIGLMEANEAATYVQELAGEDANIIFGAMYDETVQDEATITVIATGLEPAYEENIRPARVQAASYLSSHCDCCSGKTSCKSGGDSGPCLRGTGRGRARKARDSDSGCQLCSETAGTCSGSFRTSEDD